MPNEKAIVGQIIKRYGAVIDLRKNPEVIIDIIRRFADDGGLPPGGTPPTPPGPTSAQDKVTNADIMKEVLKLSRAVSKISSQLRG